MKINLSFSIVKCRWSCWALEKVRHGVLLGITLCRSGDNDRSLIEALTLSTSNGGGGKTLTCPLEEVWYLKLDWDFYPYPELRPLQSGEAVLVASYQRQSWRLGGEEQMLLSGVAGSLVDEMLE